MESIQQFIDSPWVNLIILIFGLCRLNYGLSCVKKRNNFDDRIEKIPDCDIQILWKKLTELEKIYGFFFTGYGVWLLCYSAANFFLYGYAKLNFSTVAEKLVSLPLVFVNDNIFLPITFIAISLLVILGFLLINFNSCVINQGMITIDNFGLIFRNEKDYIYSVYKSWNFESRKNGIWTKYDDRDKSDIDSLLSSYKNAIIGSFIYYPLVLFSTIYITCYGFYLYAASFH